METFGLAMLGLLMMRPEASAPAGGIEVEVHVRLRWERSPAPLLAADAHARVAAILAAAGIRLRWMECSGTDAWCDVPAAPADLDILLIPDWRPPFRAPCGGAVRLLDAPRRFSISLAWVRSTAAARSLEPAEVLARSIAHQVGHAWSPLPHADQNPAAGALESNDAALSPREAVLLAGALLQNRTSDPAVPARERLIVIAPGGRWISVTDGDPGAAVFDAATSSAMATPDAGLTLVHNHPGSSGLSGPDIMSLIKPGVRSIEAIGHDGSVYVARRGPTFRADGYHSAAALLEAAIRSLPPLPDLRATAAAHFAHLVGLVLHASDAIEYKSSLAGQRARSFRRYSVALGQAVNLASHIVREQQSKRRGRTSLHPEP